MVGPVPLRVTMKPWTPPTLYRSRNGALVAGVARGISEHLRIDVFVVRAAFVVLALAGGAGVVLYGAFWIVLPEQDGPDVPGRTTAAAAGRATRGCSSPRQRSRSGAALLLQAVGLLPDSWLPFILVAVGLVLVWLRSDDESWSRMVSRVQRGGEPGQGRVSGLQLVAGVSLVLVGAFAFLAARGAFTDAGRVLLAVTVALVGVALLAAPWVVRLLRERDEERRARIRTEERAELAAQVHDSVLQTLTLIQRSSSDPATVQRLARAQERDLRQWLYTPVPDAAATLRGGLEATAADVETAHGGAVEVVCVGDVALDDRTAALVSATREAMVNAVKYGGGAVSVYAEVEPVDIRVVRARPRPGLRRRARCPTTGWASAGSIIERMERHGGRARACAANSAVARRSSCSWRAPRDRAGASGHRRRPPAVPHRCAHRARPTRVDVVGEARGRAIGRVGDPARASRRRAARRAPARWWRYGSDPAVRGARVDRRASWRCRCRMPLTTSSRWCAPARVGT